MTTRSKEEALVSIVYQNLLQAWNNMDSKAFAGLFAKDGSLVGFDGSQANGREEIEKHLSDVFSNHKVATFIGIVREIRVLGDDTALLRAVAGMVPPGKTAINPATNAVQSMLVQKFEEKYRIAMFQNTPAAFHESPEEAEKLTRELEQQLELTRDPG